MRLETATGAVAEGASVKTRAGACDPVSRGPVPRLSPTLTGGGRRQPGHRVRLGRSPAQRFALTGAF